MSQSFHAIVFHSSWRAEDFSTAGRSPLDSTPQARHRGRMPTSHLLPHDVTSLAKLQSGLVTLDQALGLGMSPSMVKTMLRRGTWVRVGRNVFVTHSGELGWHARAWTAILVAGEGSMLAGRSAGHLQRLVPDEPQIVHVVVPAERRVRDFPGVRFERKRRVPRPVGALPRTPRRRRRRRPRSRGPWGRSARRRAARRSRWSLGAPWSGSRPPCGSAS